MYIKRLASKRNILTIKQNISEVGRAKTYQHPGKVREMKLLTILTSALCGLSDQLQSRRLRPQG